MRLLCLLPLLLWAAFAASQDIDGRATMEKIFGQDRTASRWIRTTLLVVDRQGRATTKRFVEYRIVNGQERKTLLEFSEPPEIRGLQLLSVVRPGLDSQQWIVPATTHRARKVAQPDRSRRFAGSDFTYEDLGDPVLDDFAFRLRPEERSVNGHPSRLIEAIPLSPDLSQYSMVRYWVAQDIPCILVTEMVDRGGRTVRTLEASQFENQSGVWGPRRVEARSVLEGTHSVLTIDEVRFEAGLKDDMFSPEAMEAAPNRDGIR